VEKELTHFFNTSLTTGLGKLKTDSKAEWGTMTAKQMLMHLIQSSKMMHFGNSTLLIKEEYIEKAIAFLYSDKEIKRGLVVPKEIGYSFDDDIATNIDELKEELIEATNTMIIFLAKNKDFKAIHPFFGELTTVQWLMFQRKHYTHHLSQFGLL
jgi:oxepin-CoA hydrolase/3-oxo-5,6-dehydrosuberyl-CoA semialdehyde dehydrogenase